MKPTLKTQGLELAVAAFCAWQAAELLNAWRHSPFDRLGWLSFLIWLIPVAICFIRHNSPATDSVFFIILALIMAVIGRLLEVNALMGIALAFSLAGFVPSSMQRMFWLAGAISWMPALGWLAHNLPVYMVVATRLLLVVATTLPLLLAPRKIQPS